QAVSGAGYPGVASMDILGNVIPYISGEEEKMEQETQKILGSLKGGSVQPAPFVVSAQCNRVAVFDGHTETVSVKFERKPTIEEAAQVLRSFSGLPQERRLPSAPDHPIVVMEQDDYPQPARHIWLERGMATSIGRIRPCPVLDMKMVILGHNTVRGAAGAAILNGETFVELGYLES
ncbi:aspartate-semialdehyde dehydrogenase, partial [Salinispira pacifica]